MPLHCLIKRYEKKLPTIFDETARALIRAGADINGQDNQDFTAIARACEFGNRWVVRYLLFKDADLSKGANPVAVALAHNHIGLVGALVRLAYSKPSVPSGKRIALQEDDSRLDHKRRKIEQL